MKNTKTKIKTGRIILAIALLTFLINFVSADSFELWCIPQGQQIDLPTLCNPSMSPRNGPINICMHLLDNGRICPTNINFCNALDLTCSGTANTTLDTTSPNLTFISPQEGGVYNERALTLSLSASETSRIEFRDNSIGNSQWRTVCSDCQNHASTRSFKEGENNWLFKVTDESGNYATYEITFYIDTKVPKISLTEPKEGFSSGLFKVKFMESNPNNLILKYGNSETGIRNKSLNISSECSTSRDTTCETTVDLSDYDEEQINYWFELKDIANNFVQSPPKTLMVDYSPPLIESFDGSANGRFGYFTLLIQEENFDKVFYIENSEQSPKWKVLCSRLTNRICEKKLSFKDGSHEVEIKVTDKAGNFANRSASFFTDSKAPKIKSVSPKSGFTDGEFSIDFEEQNPESLILEYGNSQEGMLEHEFDFDSECVLNGKFYNCLSEINLENYEGEEINYEVTLADLAGQVAQSSAQNLGVDHTFPVINSISHVMNGNKAIITLDITENNLDKVYYADNTGRTKTFCSFTILGKCSKTLSLKPGNNNFEFQVYDRAGNSVSESHEIVL